MTVDLAYFAVLTHDFGFLSAHHALDRADDGGCIALPYCRRQSAKIGHEHRSLFELRWLVAMRCDGNFGGLLRHLRVQLFELRFVAQRVDHLAERATEN